MMVLGKTLPSLVLVYETIHSFGEAMPSHLQVNETTNGSVLWKRNFCMLYRILEGFVLKVRNYFEMERSKVRSVKNAQIQY